MSCSASMLCRSSTDTVTKFVVSLTWTMTTNSKKFCTTPTGSVWGVSTMLAILSALNFVWNACTIVLCSLGKILTMTIRKPNCADLINIIWLISSIDLRWCFIEITFQHIYISYDIWFYQRLFFLINLDCLNSPKVARCRNSFGYMLLLVAISKRRRWQWSIACIFWSCGSPGFLVFSSSQKSADIVFEWTKRCIRLTA